ncbi:hypothetical protein C8R44DRAFT_866771 [Mycena epipterygia]|nr:hypothetical protein C8R44DRAFT_866771 [Mycena epipterygia]
MSGLELLTDQLDALENSTEVNADASSGGSCGSFFSSSGPLLSQGAAGRDSPITPSITSVKANQGLFLTASCARPSSIFAFAPTRLSTSHTHPQRSLPAPTNTPRGTLYPTRSSIMPSTAGSTSSFSITPALPSPVSPTSLSMETPSLGSSDLLPRPKRGAPPVAPAPAKKDLDKKDEKLNPALCAEW